MVRFDLTQQRWNVLADSVSAVYHCAAQVNTLMPYEALRAANVEGTLEIARLICQGKAQGAALCQYPCLCLWATDRNEGVAL